MTTPQRIDGWISVKDRLPKPYENVLLCEGPYQYWFGHFDCATNELLYYHGTDTKDDKAFTHWMPLPEPPITQPDALDEKQGGKEG